VQRFRALHTNSAFSREKHPNIHDAGGGERSNNSGEYSCARQPVTALPRRLRRRPSQPAFARHSQQFGACHLIASVHAVAFSP
jgi:hypothetical protein